MGMLDKADTAHSSKIAKLYLKRTMLIYIYIRFAQELLLFSVLINRHSGGCEMAYVYFLIFNFPN